MAYLFKRRGGGRPDAVDVFQRTCFIVYK